MSSGYVGIDKDYFVSVKEVLNITAETGALETQDRVRELPPADVVEVRHGHWETVFDKIESNLSDIGYFKALPKFICSECGNEMIASTQYCPNCGAKMDGEEQENE